jgi:uncharacterized membrane protein YkgB
MSQVPAPLEPIDIRITAWMARHYVSLARVSLGIVFLWFGLLKFVPGWSPAEGLAGRTMSDLTGGRLPPSTALLILAVWETMIGIGLLARRWLRATLLLLFLQMPGTMMPLFMYPSEMFTMVPFVPTLEGQYIIKNLVLISAALVVGATVRGGRFVARPNP